MGNHLRTQPLHKTLKQYRVVAILSIVFIGWFLLECWSFFKNNHSSLGTEGVAALFSFIVALFGAFVKSVDNIQRKQEN